MFSKKNKPLIIGFAIPILMILFIAASVYIPGLFSQPKYDFLYAAPNAFYYENFYGVKNGRVTLNPQPTVSNPHYKPGPTPQLYVHDVKANKSRPVSFEEASKFTLDPSTESPDGYTIKDDNGSSTFFLFGGFDRDYNSQYIVGHNVSKKLDVKAIGVNYYGTIDFIGWLTE